MGVLGNIGGIKDFLTAQSLKRLERRLEELDNSLSTILRNNAPTARLAAAGDSYAYVTDGTNTATSLGADTFKIRSANALLTATVEDDNATHGDNLLLTVNAAAFGANPTASVGLTAVNGTATTFIRSDGAPPLSQAIVPTWTGLHTFNPSTTAQEVIRLDMAALSGVGQRDSHWLTWVGRAHDGVDAHTGEWKSEIEITDNGAASTWHLKNQVDGGGWAAKFSITDQFSVPTAIQFDGTTLINNCIGLYATSVLPMSGAGVTTSSTWNSGTDEAIGFVASGASARGIVRFGTSASGTGIKMTLSRTGILSIDNNSGAGAIYPVATESYVGTYAQPLDTDLTQIAAVNNVRGDILITDNVGPTWVRLGIGASGTILRSDGSDPAWASLATAGIAASSVTITAGDGLTGGGDLSANRTIDVGAGTGISVAANSVAVDQSFSPTWTGTHTFSLESVHNGGLDIGTSGRFDSNVANAASAINFLFQPTTTLTSGSDREIFHVRGQAGSTASYFRILSNGANEVGAGSTAGQGVAQLYSLGPTDTTNMYAGVYCNFVGTSSTSTGGSLSGVSNSMSGGVFAISTNRSVVDSGGTNVSHFGGAFDVSLNTTNPASTKTIPQMFGGSFRSTVSGSVTNNVVTLMGGVITQPSTTGMSMTVTQTPTYACVYAGAASAGSTPAFTDKYGLYVAADHASAAITNQYGVYVTEQTRGATLKYGIFLANATSTYKAIAIRDANTWIGSSAAATLDLNATTVKCVADFDLSTKNLITDTTTGTKFGTGTTQKLGWWNATPVVQDTGWGSITNVTTDRAYDANATTTDELADVLGTLIAKLVAYGILGS